MFSVVLQVTGLIGYHLTEMHPGQPGFVFEGLASHAWHHLHQTVTAWPWLYTHLDLLSQSTCELLWRRNQHFETHLSHHQDHFAHSRRDLSKPPSLRLGGNGNEHHQRLTYTLLHRNSRARA